jgi:hypothetical protein
MRNAALAVCAMVIFLGMSLPASAEPTILGPTGLIVNPTADITAVEHAWIALNFLDNDDNSLWTLNITGSVSEEFEVGVGAVHPDDGDDGLSFFLKWLFYPESEKFPGAAAGITITDVAGENTTMLYLVASKFFYLGDYASENASVHGGLSYVTGSGDDDFDFFGGVDVEIMESLIAIAEYSSDDRAVYEGFTYGVRYYFGPQFTGQAGFIDGDLTIGASLVF